MSYFRGVVLEDIHVALQNLIKLIARPLWVEPSTSRMRVTLESAGVTMTGVTTLNQLSGFTAKDTALNTLDRNLWYSSVRRCIT